MVLPHINLPYNMDNFLSIEESGIFIKNELSTVTSHSCCMLHCKEIQSYSVKL